jgi:hypothetical protein
MNILLFNCFPKPSKIKISQPVTPSAIWGRISPVMGRKTILWTDKNEVDLLANLQFVIEKIYKETGRYGTTDDVLRNLESELPEPRRTQDQIDRRLRRFWKDHNPNPEPWRTYEDIYRFGIGSLETLDSSLKDQVEEELDILRENQKLKAACTPRKTRNESRNVVAESSGPKGVDVASSARTPTKSRRTLRCQSPPHSASKRSRKNPGPIKVCELKGSTRKAEL